MNKGNSDKIKKDILNLINRKSKHVISITGGWGIGKTFLIEEIIDNYNNKLNTIYVSLFGVQSIFEIKLKIKDSIEESNSHKAFNLKKYIKKQISGLSKTEEISILGVGVSGLNNIISHYSEQSFDIKLYNIQNKIFIFDDLERVSENFDTTSFLGFINQIKNHNSIIMLLNDEKEYTKKYKIYSDKILDREFKLYYHPDEISEINNKNKFVKDFNNLFLKPFPKELFLFCVSKSNSTNHRINKIIISKLFDLIKLIETYINEDNLNYCKNYFHNFIVLFQIYYQNRQLSFENYSIIHNFLLRGSRRNEISSNYTRNDSNAYFDTLNIDVKNIINRNISIFDNLNTDINLILVDELLSYLFYGTINENIFIEKFKIDLDSFNLYQIKKLYSETVNSLTSNINFQKNELDPLIKNSLFKELSIDNMERLYFLLEKINTNNEYDKSLKEIFDFLSLKNQFPSKNFFEIYGKKLNLTYNNSEVINKEIKIINCFSDQSLYSDLIKSIDWTVEKILLELLDGNIENLKTNILFFHDVTNGVWKDTLSTTIFFDKLKETINYISSFEKFSENKIDKILIQEDITEVQVLSLKNIFKINNLNV